LAVHCCLKQDNGRRKGGTQSEFELDIQIHMIRVIEDPQFRKRWSLVSKEKLMNFVRNVELKLFRCDAFDSFDPHKRSRALTVGLASFYPFQDKFRPRS
jgi:hypothetical protein